MTEEWIPDVLDLFCGAGGISMGWHKGGANLYGIDLFKRRRPDGRMRGPNSKNYPFSLCRGDALNALDALQAGMGIPFLAKSGEIQIKYAHHFSLILASPPCWKYSRTNTGGREYPDLIPPVREKLLKLGIPYVMENVVGAPLINPVELCGCMFDMKAKDEDGDTIYLQRPRLFEASGVTIVAPGLHRHEHHEWVGGSYGQGIRDKYEAKYGNGRSGHVPSPDVQRKLLGTPWMTQYEMFECVPPRFAEYLALQVIPQLKVMRR